MSTVDLLQALWHVVAWQIRRPAAHDVRLLDDAEFQIMLRELRYPPIRRSHDTTSRRADSMGPGKGHTR